MSSRFFIDQSPSASLWNQVSRLSPENPFHTEEYAASRVLLGDIPWIFSSANHTVYIPAFVHRGRFASRLEIPSLPQSPSPGFLHALQDVCNSEGIHETILNSYASPSVQIPALPNEIERLSRKEFSLDLRVDPGTWKIGSTHRRHIRAAEKTGVTVVRSTTSEAVAQHIDLIGASMRRRKDRGEDVSVLTENPELTNIVRVGAGEIFQAVNGGIVLSSVCVLRAKNGGYDHSSGTRPEGMDIGASHFLMVSIAKILRQEGCATFNLGGARTDETGLTRFKAAFGATTTELEMVRVSLCSPAQRLAARALDLAKRCAARARSVLHRE